MKTVTEKTYTIRNKDEAAASDIVANCGLKPLTARVLVSRGITTPAQVDAFFTPSLDRDWVPPREIPGLSDVADRVQAAIEGNQHILVFGDFDVDGITATAISVRGLRALGAQADGLIPHRHDEGYALSEAALERGMLFEPDLIVTVDCGISCAKEVQLLQERGIDIVVTDHHEPGENVPSGISLADPKLDEACPSRDLAGAGVALKLIAELGQRMGKPELWRELVDFAALGTVADLMPLKGENRALVSQGINDMKNAPRACILALCAACMLAVEDIDSSKLSFKLIPRMNAAGRMGDATIVLDLLLSDDVAQTQTLAQSLEEINNSRREAESQLANLVKQQLAEASSDDPIVIAAGEGWHEGVKGIVASRIARLYKRPALIFTIDGDKAQGSGRTYGDVNLFELASSCSDLFEKFGGHAAAIGITLPVASLPELKKRLCQALQSQDSRVASSKIVVDTDVSLEECTIEAFSELQKLQPFGSENPIPGLVAPGVFLEDKGTVGKQGNHFKFNAENGAAKVAGIFFGSDNIEDLVNCEAACDVFFEPSVDEWRGRHTPKLMTRQIRIAQYPQQQDSAIAQHVDELFDHEAEICDTGEYAGITQMARFNTKIVGVTFDNRQELLSSLHTGVELSLVRQPFNEFDENAIAVCLQDGSQLGYLKSQLAARIAPAIDSGVAYDAQVAQVTGGSVATCADAEIPNLDFSEIPGSGTVERSYGVNIVVRRCDLDVGPENDRQPDDDLHVLKLHWQDIAKDHLQSALRETLIGPHELHDAQAKALEYLSMGKSTLAIMATGRGKSLIFHLHAALEALQNNKASVFIYPLRALVADQAFHLQETFARFGLRVCVLTGESPETERSEIFSGLADASVDVVLTTPEFFTIHASKFAQTGRIGFVVVDEAHHIGLSRAGNRPAYADLTQALAVLGNPLVLAVTATADNAVAGSICRTLGIQALVTDPTLRTNLHIDDKRDLRKREEYLASIVASGGKCVAYVNSRDQSLALTRMLRKRVPQAAARIAFYNAGLSKEDRKIIETAFREGELQVIISTSAFGEGVDIPDIENVVLYHLPFNDVEFNQMSGRAGRDGRDACIHLLYGYGDSKINEKILESNAPSRESMVALYKALRQIAEGSEDDTFVVSNAQLASAARKLDSRAKLDESGVSCGLSVFRELGFLSTFGSGVSRRIQMVESPKRMELSNSVRYREGKEELADFAEFKQWALSANAQELLGRFNKPILPTEALNDLLC